MSRYLNIWISPNASAVPNWAQRKGPEEIEGAEANETGTLHAGMKSCFVLTGAQSPLMHIFKQVGSCSVTILTDFFKVKLGMFLK